MKLCLQVQARAVVVVFCCNKRSNNNTRILFYHPIFWTTSRFSLYQTYTYSSQCIEVTVGPFEKSDQCSMQKVQMVNIICLPLILILSLYNRAIAFSLSRTKSLSMSSPVKNTRPKFHMVCLCTIGFHAKF